MASEKASYCSLCSESGYAKSECVTSWYIDIGDCECSCEHCGARFGYGERLKGYSKDRRVCISDLKPGDRRQKQNSRSEGIPEMGESKATKASTN
ncbi:hypothetical protein Tco_1144034 [Tanacetum coccineum]